MYRGLTKLEILGIAIKKEKDAAKFYQDLARRIPNPIIKEKFNSLAKEERKHRAILNAEYKKITGDRPVVPEQWKSAHPEETISGDASIEELLLFAIERERDAQKLYKNGAKTAEGETSRVMFEYLVEFEKGHERTLKAELAFYKKAPLFFEEYEEGIHVGA